MIRIGAGKTLKLLDQMLTDAINNTFDESRFDETELSRLESKWKQFLVSSKLSMERIHEERAEIRSLVADISHQSKTPLANIMLYSELLLEKVQNKEEIRLAEQILYQSERLEFLISSLVKMSRLESDILNVVPTCQPVQPLIEWGIEAVSQKALKKGIQMSVDIGEDSVLVWYDMKWTEEALMNVLDNAIKYSPEDSSITVSVKEFEFYICISVHDQGIGIREAEKAQIFDRFYRSSQVQQEEGIGIGLYLTRQILQKEGGYIKVSSVPDQGSTFGLYLRRQ